MGFKTNPAPSDPPRPRGNARLPQNAGASAPTATVSLFRICNAGDRTRCAPVREHAGPLTRIRVVGGGVVVEYDVEWVGCVWVGGGGWGVGNEGRGAREEARRARRAGGSPHLPDGCGGEGRVRELCKLGPPVFSQLPSQHLLQLPTGHHVCLGTHTLQGPGHLYGVRVGVGVCRGGGGGEVGKNENESAVGMERGEGHK